MEDTTDTSTVTISGEPFDPTKVDIHHRNINTVYQRVIVEGEAVNTIYVNWIHDYSKMRDHEDNQRPEWADLPIDERKFMVLPDKLANVITRQHLMNPNRFVHELPCPPYDFAVEEGKLVIKAGAFEKSGTKAEWKEVIDQMQREVEDMPDGIDITDLPDVTIELSFTATTSYDMSVDSLLSGHEMFSEDGLWIGDRSDLESALEYAVDEFEASDHDIDMSYAEWGEVDVTGSDVDYCIRQIDG